MRQKRLEYIYGPVSSWRLGRSLGVDPLSQKEKVCNFDCIYCQLGKTSNYEKRRKLYISTKKVVEDFEMLPNVKIDYITFSGRGEPSLAQNLGRLIKTIKAIRPEPIAVLTNSSLMHKKDVRGVLSGADFVAAKLDAYSQGSFELINRPAAGIKFTSLLDGIKKFRGEFKGKFALQIMFVEQNKDHARELAGLAREINPDEVQINTPSRPCEVEPLSREKLARIKECFGGMNTILVYGAEHKEVSPVSGKDTITRRGKIL